MADDDDWETEADYVNDLTEKEQRAFGNKETMTKYNAVMEKAGASIPGESKMTTTQAASKPIASAAVEVSDPAPRAPAPPPAAPAAPAATPTPPKPIGKINMEGRFGGSSPEVVQQTAPASASSAAKAPTPRARSVHTSDGRSGGVLSNRTRRISDQTKEQLEKVFKSFDVNGDGTVDVGELGAAMEKLGMASNQDRLAAMVTEVDADNSGTISFDEFTSVVERVRTTGGSTLTKQFSQVVNSAHQHLMQQKTGNVVHSFAQEECAAFVEFINTKLGGEPHMGYLLPMAELTELFTACADGVLLCKLINLAAPETIDERVVNIAPGNRFLISENLNSALNAAKSIGLTVVNIGPGDIMEGRPHLILGLVWQLVKMALLANINLKANPNLIRLLREGETLEELLRLPPEKLLLRWFNYHLEQAGVAKRIANFGADLKDSEMYAHLLSRIDPEKLVKPAALLGQSADHVERARAVIKHTQRLGAEFTVQPKDIATGNEKLNLGLVAALFNACPGLLPPDAEAAALLEDLPEENEGDSREERAFRMWINSLGLDEAFFCHRLYDDVTDGNLILHVMEAVRPGVVEWGRVNKPPIKMVFKRIENLNYAVDLGKGPFGFSLVGLQGKDISDGNQKLTLALVWQLMRCHLTAFLSSMRSQAAGGGTDEAMLKWANEQVAASGASTSLRDFSDKSVASGLFLIDLLAAVEPRCIERSHVTAGASAEEKELNAKYAVSSARKLGCSLFCTWEDIVDARPKMVLSFVATVMSFSCLGRAPTVRK